MLRSSNTPSPSRSTGRTASPSEAERSYRGVGTAQRKAERRQRLIDAAVRCFGRDGYHSTTLKALCSEAGLTERYFYESFTNFEEILCCAYEHSAVTLLEIVTSSIAAAGEDLAARVHAGFDSYLKAIAADPARARLVLIEIEGAGENANNIYRTRLRLSAALIRDEFFRGWPDNPGNGLSLDLLSTAVLGAVYQLAKEWTLSDFKLPRATLVRNIEALAAGAGREWAAPPAPASVKPVKQGKSK